MARSERSSDAGAPPPDRGVVGEIVPSLLMLAALTVVTGVIYPLVVTGIAQLAFPRQANGSLIVRDGRIVGSSWIGQPF